MAQPTQNHQPCSVTNQMPSAMKNSAGSVKSRISRIMRQCCIIWLLLLPKLLGQHQLFFVVALQLFGLGRVPLVDSAEVIARGFAEGEGGGAGEGAAGDRAEKWDELRHLARGLPYEHAGEQRARDL